MNKIRDDHGLSRFPTQIQDILRGAVASFEDHEARFTVGFTVKSRWTKRGEIDHRGRASIKRLMHWEIGVYPLGRSGWTFEATSFFDVAPLKSMRYVNGDGDGRFYFQCRLWPGGSPEGESITLKVFCDQAEDPFDLICTDPESDRWESSIATKGGSE